MPNLYDYKSYLSLKQIPKPRIPRKGMKRVDIPSKSSTSNTKDK